MKTQICCQGVYSLLLQISFTHVERSNQRLYLLQIHTVIKSCIATSHSFDLVSHICTKQVQYLHLFLEGLCFVLFQGVKPADNQNLLQVLSEHCIAISEQVGYSGGTSDKEHPCQCRIYQRHGFNPLGGKSPWRRAWQPTPVCLSGESHGPGSRTGHSPIESQRVRHE